MHRTPPDLDFESLRYPSKSESIKEIGRKILTPSARPKNVFGGRHLGLVQEKTLIVFYTRMPREEVGGRKKISPGVRRRVLFV